MGRSHADSRNAKWLTLHLPTVEKSHRNKVAKNVRPLLKNKKLAVLDIPDNFDFMDPVLVRILRNRVPKYVSIR